MVNVSVSYPPHLWGIVGDDKQVHWEIYRTEWCQRCGTLRGQQFNITADPLLQTPVITQYRVPDGPWAGGDEPHCRALGVTTVADLVVVASDATKSMTVKNIGLTIQPVEGRQTWPVAGLFEPERDTRGKKTVARSPSYASLVDDYLAVAECWAVLPDGTGRKVTVCVNPQALLDWALANLPHDAMLYGRDNDIVAWVKPKE